MKKNERGVFSGKEIILGVTGSIAAYKACELASYLKKLGANLSVIMTENAKRFITPLSLQYLSAGKVYDDPFCLEDWSDKHVGLAKKADLIVVAPASADFIARAAQGRASDLLSSTILATSAPVVIVPAMNSGMYTHQITQSNIRSLKKIGYRFVGPEKGLLACGDEGIGRMVDVKAVTDYIGKLLK